MKGKYRKVYAVSLVLAMTVMVALGGAGCARTAAPRGKLDYSLYAPEGSMISEGQYVIGVRDELDVFVWRCPELDSSVTVRPEDGKITLPLIGDVKAAGLTPKQLAKSISKRMEYYVKEPKIAVGVKKFGEKKVYIMGEVISQGTYRLERSDRIIDLITRAGGFTPDAVPSTTYIVRGNYHDHKTVRVNLARLLHEGDMTQNVYLEEGDIVYVPEDLIDNYNRALQKIFPTLFFAQKVGELKLDIMRERFDWHEVWNKMGDKDYTRPGAD